MHRAGWLRERPSQEESGGDVGGRCRHRKRPLQAAVTESGWRRCQRPLQEAAVTGGRHRKRPSQAAVTGSGRRRWQRPLHKQFPASTFPSRPSAELAPRLWEVWSFSGRFLLAPRRVTHQPMPNPHPVMVSFTGAVFVSFRLALLTRFHWFKNC